MGGGITRGPKKGSNIEMAKPPVFSKEAEKMGVIAQGGGQTLGLELGQSKDIVVVFY